MLKVGHHGSNSSTTPGLVDTIHPSVAIISRGRATNTGTRRRRPLATFAARPGIAVFRTDLQGDVEVVTDGVPCASGPMTSGPRGSPCTGGRHGRLSGLAARSPNERVRKDPTIGRCWSARTAASQIPTARLCGFCRSPQAGGRRRARGAPDGHDRVQRPAGSDQARGGPRPRIRPSGDEPLLRRHDRRPAPATEDDREVHRRCDHGGSSGCRGSMRMTRLAGPYARSSPPLLR